MNARIKKKHQKQFNKELCERYPFLIPRSYDDKIIWKRYRKGNKRKVSPYSFTELDYMPRGWRETFGLVMCEEIRNELIKFNYLDKYRIAEIKEKYGILYWYDFGQPAGSNIHEIINKYRKYSMYTCMICGAFAETSYENGWAETICDNCKQELLKKFDKF